MAAYDITVLGTPEEFFATQENVYSVCKLSDTRFVVAWEVSQGSNRIQAFDLNRSTGEITPLSTPLTISSGTWWNNVSPLISLSATTCILIWQGASGDGFCRTYNIDAGTGAVTVRGSEYEFETTEAENNSAVLMSIDATNARILNVWTRSNKAYAGILTVTLSTGAVTLTGTAYNIDAQNMIISSVAKISDSKVLVTSRYGASLDKGNAVVLNINTSTWAVTSAGSTFEWISGVSITSNSAAIISTSPLVAVNNFSDTSDVKTRPLSINDSTWAVTNLGSVVSLGGDDTNGLQPTVLRVDDTHYVVVVTDITDKLLNAETYEINTSTGTVTLKDSELLGAYYAFQGVVCDMGEGLYVSVWARAVTDAGSYAVAFQVEMPVAFTPSPLMHLMGVSGGLF